MVGAANRGNDLMRLALVGDYPLDPKEIENGPQAVFVYLLEGLRPFPDLDIRVVTAKRNLDETNILERDGVRFYYLPYPRLPAELSFFILRRRVHKTLHKIKPDLVHSQSGHRYGAMCLSAGYPAALTPHNVHGAEVAFTAGRFNRLRLSLHFAVSRRYFIANVRHIVSISPYIRRSYEPSVKARFYDIDNPISDAFFNLDPEHEIPNQILFVGMLRTRKRPDLALAALALAVKEVPKLCLHFAGAPVEPALYERMQAFIAGHHLKNNVKFLGHLQETEILKCYQNTSILLLTSDLETSPMAVQQALAAGKPVIATDGGGTRYLIEQGRNGFVVEQNNPTQLAQALVKLAKEDVLRREFGHEARRAALTRFKSKVVAAKMYDMYQDILENYELSC
jgi:glycosyltransferase involved in cell wall biosynthesis